MKELIVIAATIIVLVAIWLITHVIKHNYSRSSSNSDLEVMGSNLSDDDFRALGDTIDVMIDRTLLEAQRIDAQQGLSKDDFRALITGIVDRVMLEVQQTYTQQGLSNDDMRNLVEGIVDRALLERMRAIDAVHLSTDDLRDLTDTVDTNVVGEHADNLDVITSNLDDPHLKSLLSTDGLREYAETVDEVKEKLNERENNGESNTTKE